MKITAQEEYGLRVLIRIASCKDSEGMSIPQLSETEQLSQHYIAKLTRLLRMAYLIRSTPGNKGGYVLAKPAKDIVIKNVLEALGGAALDKEFTDETGAVMRFCTSSVDCSSRSLWQMIQMTVNNLLEKITLNDLVSENETKFTIFDELSTEFLERR